MERIKLRVTGNQIEVLERPAVMTAGTVGLMAEFIFDSQWDALSKTAVFKAGDKVVATALEKGTCVVPWEVLAQPNQWLYIGIYGANAEGTVVIPTLWAKVAVVHTGTDPEGDPAMEPTAPVWQTVLTRLEGVTAEGVGAATREEMDAVQAHLLSLQDDVDGHRENVENPHGVTAEQIGAATEEYVDIMVSTKASPEEVADEVQSALRIAGLTDHAHNAENPHGVTAEQVGAAPAGFGLGEKNTPALRWMKATANGFYRSNVDAPDDNWWWGITVSQYSGVCTQIAFSVVEENMVQAIRRRDTSQFYAWEYVNPPMLPNVEYRTTERWNGKAVYTKLIDLHINPEEVAGAENKDFYDLVTDVDAVVSAEYRELQGNFNKLNRNRELYLDDGAVSFAIYGANLDLITEATLLLKYTKTN